MGGWVGGGPGGPLREVVLMNDMSGRSDTIKMSPPCSSYTRERDPSHSSDR